MREKKIKKVIPLTTAFKNKWPVVKMSEEVTGVSRPI